MQSLKQHCINNKQAKLKILRLLQKIKKSFAKLPRRKFCCSVYNIGSSEIIVNNCFAEHYIRSPQTLSVWNSKFLCRLLHLTKCAMKRICGGFLIKQVNRRTYVCICPNSWGRCYDHYFWRF
jgi:hypothetical protein